MSLGTAPQIRSSHSFYILLDPTLKTQQAPQQYSSSTASVSADSATATSRPHTLTSPSSASASSISPPYYYPPPLLPATTTQNSLSGPACPAIAGVSTRRLRSRGRRSRDVLPAARSAPSGCSVSARAWRCRLRRGKGASRLRARARMLGMLGRGRGSRRA